MPKLLEEGQAKAEAEGLEIEWVESDAEQLPFEDASFDRVLSTFGPMFAPGHRRVYAVVITSHRESLPAQAIRLDQ